MVGLRISKCNQEIISSLHALIFNAFLLCADLYSKSFFPPKLSGIQSVSISFGQGLDPTFIHA